MSWALNPVSERLPPSKARQRAMNRHRQKQAPMIRVESKVFDELIELEAGIVVQIIDSYVGGRSLNFLDRTTIDLLKAGF